jgi:hypothetical protein
MGDCIECINKFSSDFVFKELNNNSFIFSSSVGGKGLVDIQPHWVSALAWPEEGPATAWSGESPELLLVGRMDGSLGLIEVVDVSTMHRRELEHCYRKDGK